MKLMCFNKYEQVCCCSVAKSCPFLWDSVNSSTWGFPVLCYLPEFAQTQVHWVSNTIQPFHPLSPSSFAFNFSQHQGNFQWVGSLHQVVKVLQCGSFSPSSEYSGFPFGLTVGSPCSPRDSQESSPTPQFKSINSLALSFHYGPTLTSIHDYWKNHSFDFMDICQQSNISAF